MRAIDNSFERVKRQISGIVRRHQRRHGGEWEELLSVAWQAFAEAWHSHDPQKAAFTTHVQCRVQFALKDHSRKAIKSNRTIIDTNALHSVATKRNFLKTLLSEVSDDARTLILLALDYNSMAEKRERCRVWQALLADLNWSIGRAFRAWNEVKEAL